MDNGYITSEDFTETSVRVKKLGPRQLGKYTCRAQVISFFKKKRKVVFINDLCKTGYLTSSLGAQNLAYFEVCSQNAIVFFDCD